MKVKFLLMLAAAGLWAQDKRTLTIEEAEKIALENHPRVAAAKLGAAAAKEVARQAKASLYPFLSGAMSGSTAVESSRIGAGALNASSLWERFGLGMALTQNLYDFGRTSSLVRSAEQRAEAQAEGINVTRAAVVLRVRQAYYQALLAEAARNVAEETVEARRVTLKQIRALTESNLRSTLDLSFAEVSVSEAELLLFQAESLSSAALVELAAAMGYQEEPNFRPAEIKDLPLMEKEVQPLVAQAMADRPEIAVARKSLQSARSLAFSESRLAWPSVTAAGVGGFIPTGDARLKDRYGAAGFTVSVPVFNGYLNNARKQEAELRSLAIEQELRDLEIRITSEVRTAWLDTGNAWRRIEVTAKLLDQATRTLKLARSRYELGLGNIVEFTQAELSRTSAEIANATARYGYLVRRAQLDYQAGRLR